MASQLTRRAFLGLVAVGSISVGGTAVFAASQPPASAQPQLRPVEVTLRPWLAKQSTSRQQRLHVTFRPGLTPTAIAEAEGIMGADLMAVMNGVQTNLTAPLAAGDRVELITGMAGG